MKWSEDEKRKHKKAARLLYEIIKESFEFVEKNKNITEKGLQKFILERFKHHKLKTEKTRLPIVAFNENSAFPHYQPKEKSKKLKPNTFILLDVWARLEEKNSPYADITWVAYYGETLPEKIKKVFHLVLRARNLTLSLIKSKLKEKRIPIGKEIHEKTSDFLIDNGYEKNILHGTGHTIGFRSPHGSGHDSYLNKKGKEKLLTSVGYTIEPGLYFKNEFGIRSEVDFYIDEKKKIYVTTSVQKEMVMIKPKPED